MKSLTFTLLLLAFSSMTTFGQHFLCGTTSEEPQDFDYEEYANFVANYSQQATSRSKQMMDTVRIKLFISGPKASNKQFADNILQLITEVNEHVKDANFLFHIDKENVTYISDNYFSIYKDAEHKDSLRNTYNDKDALDMYVFDQVYTNEVNSLPGFSTGNLIDGGFLVLNKNFLSKSLIAHELGHSMSLRHTHGKFNSEDSTCILGYIPPPGIPVEVYCRGAVRYDNQPDLDENQDGIPDCLQTGDNVCDTNADPGLHLEDMVRDCKYIGTARDYYGDVYDPEINNFMNYAPSHCKCSFTEGQLIKMRYYLDKYLECNCNKQSGSTITVVGTEAEGKGTLNEAITCLNYCERLDKINFDLPEEDSVLLINNLPWVLRAATINGLTKYGTRITLDGGSKNLGLRMNGKSFQAQNLNIRSCSSHGLSVFSSKNILVENCNFKDNSGEGLYIVHSDKGVIQNVSSMENDRSGLYLQYSKNIKINNSYLSKNNLAGLAIIESQSIVADSLIIKENGSEGLYLDSLNGVVVRNISSIENDRSGLFVTNSTNVEINNSSLSNNELAGVALFESQHITADSLIIEKNGNAGLYIDSLNELVIQNISSIENGESGLYIQNATNVEINNSSLSKNGLAGLAIVESQHISADSLITEENGNIGLYATQSTHLEVNSLHSISNLDKGLLFIENDTILVNNSVLSDNRNHGMQIFNTNQVGLYGNKIKNNPIGLVLNYARRITIGGRMNGQANQITNNIESGISIENNTQFTTISQNIWACNEVGITKDSTTAKGIIPPTINPITDPNMMSGTSGKGEVIALYKSSNCSPTCEGEIFITEVIADDNGRWSGILEEPLEDGERITAISTKDNNSSTFSDCVLLDCVSNPTACMTTSINDISTTNLFEVFPNPVVENLTINSLSSKTSGAQASLYNAQGKLLSQHLLNAQKNTISMGNHSSGMYILLIDTEEGQFKQKIVK